jgi:AraC family transcriptional regulator, alkane utilization regulator
MDVLSDVLHTVRLRSIIYCHSELTAPWGLHVEGIAERAGFFVVTRGSCYLETEGLQAPLALAGGDLIVLPHGGGYTLRDALTSPVAPLQDLLASCPANGHKALRHGSGGTLTTMVQGCFQFENGATSPLLGALPSLIHVRGENGQMVPWLEVTLKFIACEATSQLPWPLAHIVVSHRTAESYWGRTKTRLDCLVEEMVVTFISSWRRRSPVSQRCEP